MAAHKDRLIRAAELLDMNPDDLMQQLDQDAEKLPAAARAVADHVVSELWIAVDHGQVESEADYAADVIERLLRAYPQLSVR